MPSLVQSHAQTPLLTRGRVWYSLSSLLSGTSQLMICGSLCLHPVYWLEGILFAPLQESLPSWGLCLAYEVLGITTSENTPPPDVGTCFLLLSLPGCCYKTYFAASSTSHFGFPEEPPHNEGFVVFLSYYNSYSGVAVTTLATTAITLGCLSRAESRINQFPIIMLQRVVLDCAKLVPLMLLNSTTLYQVC